MTSKYDDMNDESLMGDVHAHNHEAFSILIKRHSKRFYHTAYHIVMEQQAAEDIVQNAFLKIWDKPQIWKKNQKAKFTTWFHRIVVNQAIDFYRAGKKIIPFDAGKHDTSNKENQHQELEKTQTQIALDKAMKALPENQFLALNLCFYEDVPREDAAKIIGVKKGALDSLIMRAKANIRDELTRQKIIDEQKRG